MKKPRFTIVARSLVDDKSKNVLRLRVTYLRRVSYFSLGIYCPAGSFSASQQKLLGFSTEYFKINAFLNETLNKAFDVFFELSKKGEFSIDNFKKHFVTGSNKFCFFDWCFKALEKRKYMLRPGTFKSQKSSLRTLGKFCKNKIFLENLNYKFLSNYFVWLLQSGMCKNSAYRHMRVLRTYVNIARKEGILTEYCFDNFSIKEIVSSRTHLSAEDLAVLEHFYENNLLKNKNGLRAFLFACYTGLRYSEVASLRWSNVNKNIITVYQDKTSKIIDVPLCSKAIAIMGTKNKSDLVFKISTNQVINRYLKRCAEIAGIKPFTFHVARHTFATISLNLGIPIEVVSSLLGHSSIKTTQIYAKILNETKIKAMRLWDGG